MQETLEFFGSKTGLVVCLALAAFGVYLLVNHSGHLLTALPYIILLACPLLHVFGHKHAHHGSLGARRAD